MTTSASVTPVRRSASWWARSQWVLPAALFGGLLLLYISTLTEVHTFDALSYVTSVEHKPWTEVFHPHHLAYGPLGSLALLLGRLAGYRGGAALPMQLLNALAGALGCALFCITVRRVTARSDLALVASLLLGGSYAYWYYAVEIEVYTVAALCLIICLDLLAQTHGRLGRRRMLALGAAQGVAVLFHQTNMLLSVPILLAFLFQHRSAGTTTSAQNKEQRTGWGGSAGRSIMHGGHDIAALLAYLAALVAVVAVPYGVVGFGISGFRSWLEFEAWLMAYARTGWWGGALTSQKWAGLGQGLADTLAQPAGTSLWLLLIGLALLYLRHGFARAHLLLVAVISWLVVYGGFFLWWEPDNIEFWIASLPPALLLLTIMLRSAPRWGPAIWIGLAIAVSCLGFNYAAIVRRGDAQTDLQRKIARELGVHLQDADLALIPDGLLELYLPYYENHRLFLSLNQALFEAGGNWETACDTIRSKIAITLHAGGMVVFADQVLRPPELLLRRHRISQDQIEQCFAVYRDTLQPLGLSAELPIYWRLPRGQEQAEQAGWRFVHFAHGWQAANVIDEQFTGGWRFTPNSDPALTSPLLAIAADRYQAIEIRLANKTAARDAQLFFSDSSGQIDEARSLRWTLEPGSDSHTYYLPLQGQPGWQGTIVRLRLDPVGVGDGGEVIVEWIRLMPK